MTTNVLILVWTFGFGAMLGRLLTLDARRLSKEADISFALFLFIATGVASVWPVILVIEFLKGFWRGLFPE